MFRVLSNEQFVNIRVLSEEYDNVIARLYWMATELPFSALIDVGASITGVTNKEVAAILMLLGLDGFDGVVSEEKT